MYYLEEKNTGWKERGAGMLKVNVPERCVDFDDDGNAIAASFDASTLEREDDEEAGDTPRSKVVRLIMRQDSTHRVILNTVLLPATEFQHLQTIKSNSVVFTAFEGPDAKPVSVQMKVCVLRPGPVPPG